MTDVDEDTRTESRPTRPATPEQVIAAAYRSLLRLLMRLDPDTERETRIILRRVLGKLEQEFPELLQPHRRRPR
jgi:hypothetical protein